MAFDDITPEMFEEGVESENTEEVAELPEESTDEGAKEQETTEPASDTSVQDDKTNSAFAEMRRAKEEAEKKAMELEQRIAELEEPDEEEEVDYEEQALDEIIDSLSDEELMEFIAEKDGITTEEVMAQLKARAELDEVKDANSKLEARIEELEEQIEESRLEAATYAAEKEMAQDLAEIRKFDPTVKSLNDLPPAYAKFRNTMAFDGTYMNATEAYVAAKQMEEKTKVKPAQEIGRVNKSETESEYYTQDEIDAMTSEEKSANWEKIMRSLPRLK